MPHQFEPMSAQDTFLANATLVKYLCKDVR